MNNIAISVGLSLESFLLFKNKNVPRDIAHKESPVGLECLPEKLQILYK